MKLYQEKVYKPTHIPTSLQRRLREEIADLERQEAEARRLGNTDQANALGWKIQARLDRLKGKAYTPMGDNIIALK